MRILFATQSDSLRLFEALRAALAERIDIERVGFTVADSFSYGQWLAERPDFERQGHLIVKEWQVTADREGRPDLDRLARWEAALGDGPGLFGAVVADRRLFMGPNCTYSQDYRRRFSDDELLCILEAGLAAVERLFDTLKPDLVVGFICVTMLDYLVYLFARARGIRLFNIRPTRVADRIILSTTLNDPDPAFAAAFERALDAASPRLAEARAHIARVRETHGRYEGAVRPSDKPALKLNQRRRPPWQVAAGVWRNWRTYRRGPARTDNHVPDPVRALAFAALVNPLRARLARRQLQGAMVVPEALPRRYAFYPLHTEPEVSLLVYGRPFVNQIEILRAVAISLPADMMLVVKEHPWMVGKRSAGAYRKMLEIPKLRFAPPHLDARVLIRDAALVTVVTGSIALEAAILGTPVITFGDCPYNLLPDTMVQRCADPRHLPQQIRTLLGAPDGRGDDAALEAYVAAAYETSRSINLYSVLLNKQNVYVERAAAFSEEVAKLADFCCETLESAPMPTPRSPDTARW